MSIGTVVFAIALADHLVRVLFVGLPEGGAAISDRRTE